MERFHITMPHVYCIMYGLAPCARETSGKVCDSVGVLVSSLSYPVLLRVPMFSSTNMLTGCFR